MSNDTRRARFPGAQSNWARFDGPAGTQMVDTAIAAASEWAASGNNANTEGAFFGADECDELLTRTRASVARLLTTDPDGVCFGANMTTMTLAFTRAVAATLRPGDRVVGTRLDHDANVSPWRIACEMSGAEHVLAPFDPGTGLLDPGAVADLIDERTKWVAVTGASNLLGSVVDLPPVVAAAHDAGAKVFVDGVHLVPHRRVDLAELGCDAFVTSPYKWYGPHAGVLCASPGLLDTLPVAKVRPASDTGPRRWETGTPNFEAIAAVDAATRYLLDEDIGVIGADEAAVATNLLDGLGALDHVRVWGPPTMEHRVPTVAFTVDGVHPDDVARRLAAAEVAVWAGACYAVEVVDHLGLAEGGGVVRAGVVGYVTDDDVTRLLSVVAALRTK